MTTQLALRVDTTPTDPNATHRHRILAAVIAAAEIDNGLVSLNRVRGLIPDDVPPHLIGRTIQALRGRGVLEPAGWETNDDRRSGNGGKPQTRYRFVDVPGGAS